MILYEEQRRWILMFARKVQRRCHAAGAASIQFDDIVSECNVGWCLARNAFDESYNVPFFAFMKTGIIRHINRWVAGEIEDGVALSLDATTEEENFYPQFEDQTLEPADEGMVRRHQEIIGRHLLSEEARRVVELLLNPPQELLEEVKAMQARRLDANRRGVKNIVKKGLTTEMIFDLLGYGEVEIREIKRDFRRVSSVVASLEV